MATFLTMGSPNSRPLHLGDSVSDRPCCSEVGIGRSETIEMTPQSFAVGPRSDVHSTDVHSTDVHSTDVHSTNVHSTNVHSTNVHSTDVHSTDVHSTDVHSTGVIPVAANGGGPFLFGFDHPIFAW